MVNFFQGLLLILLLTSSQSWAVGSVVEGWVCPALNSTTFCIIEKESGKRIDLISDYFEVRFDLKKLRNNDYAVLNGVWDKKQNIFKAIHVEFVGLQRILGLWGSTTGAIYNFADFSNLLIYFNQSQPMGYHLKYSIAPENTSDWTIFITTEDISIGRLKIRNKQIQIDFYDLDTGKVQNTLNLTSIESAQ